MQVGKSLKQKGTEQFKNKNYHKAMEYYSSYIQEEHEDNIQTMLNIAFCYYRLEEYESGISMCDQILEIDEKYSKCYYRRAMCRKEIIDKDNTNMLQRYKLYYDCLMFKKYSDSKGLQRELEEFATMGKSCKQLIALCQPTKISSFQRSLIQLQKENINLYAISELQQKFSKHWTGEKDDHRHQIDRLYKEMMAVKREIKDAEELKIMVDIINDKIKLIRKDMQASKQADETSKQQQQKSVTTDTKESKEELNSKLEAANQIKTQNQSPAQTENESNFKLGQQQRQQVKSEANNPIETVTVKVHQQKNLEQEKLTKKSVPKCESDGHKVQQAKEEVKIQSHKNQQIKNQTLTPALEGKQKLWIEDKSFTVQSLLKNIKERMSKSRDTFLQFSKTLMLTLNSTQIPTNIKSQLLKALPKNIVNFKLIVMNMPTETKARLKQVFNSIEISQQIQKFYIK